MRRCNLCQSCLRRWWEDRETILARGRIEIIRRLSQATLAREDPREWSSRIRVQKVGDNVGEKRERESVCENVTAEDN